MFEKLLKQYKVIFIAGTDTEVGKTHVACHLLRHMTECGYKTLGLKPIASGARQHGEIWVNEDTLKLQKAALIKQDYKILTPYLFKPEIAPNIAALEASTHLDATMISQKLIMTLKATAADFTLIEGAGGILTPLNYQEMYIDVIKKLSLPVILVVGMKLGCINHALLTTPYLSTINYNYNRS